MKISVLIPAYNEEQFIGKSLAAILAQDHPDFEVIVIDNGSADRTMEVARSYGGVKVITELNKGTMWACERGRREAMGDLIVRMDADCLPDRDWLSRGERLFDDENVVGASGPYDYYDASTPFRWFTLVSQKGVYFPVSAIMQALGLGAVSVGGNTFARGSVLQRIGGFDTSIVFYGDDTDLPKRLTRVGRFVYDPRLVMPTSSRRFARTGYLKLAGTYVYHFFKTVFSGT